MILQLSAKKGSSTHLIECYVSLQFTGSWMYHTPNYCRLQGYTNVVVACQHSVVQMPMLCWMWSGDITLKLAVTCKNKIYIEKSIPMTALWCPAFSNHG